MMHLRSREALGVLICAVLTLSACASAPLSQRPQPIETGQYDPALKGKVVPVAQALFLYNADLCPVVKTVSLPGRDDFEICHVTAAIYASDVRNAHIEPAQGGGDRIWLSSALVEALSANELAFLIAHELAHRISGHDLEAGSKPHLELQADEAAQYLLARAGYDLSAGEGLIRRLNIGASGQTDSHPAQGDRLAVLARARNNIKQMQARGDDIIPPNARSGL